MIYYHPEYIGSMPDHNIPRTMLWWNLGAVGYLGASFWTNSFEMVIWLGGGVRYFVRVDNHADWNFQHAGFGSTDIQRVAPLNGWDPTSSTTASRLFGYAGGAGPYRCRFWRRANNFLSQRNVAVITPHVAGPFLITNGMSVADLQTRAAAIKVAFTANLSAGVSILAYLEEAYNLVPMEVGVLLMQAHDHPGALDWFRTVYDYTQPEAQRPIYYGLVVEESRPESWSRATDWLLDPLNPHLIGATRRDSSTRYTLQTIIACLLDYADSEFARDTAEALDRADPLLHGAGPPRQLFAATGAGAV